MTDTWSNWSGSVTCTPQRIAMPTSEADVAALLKQASVDRATVRVAGTGHSFTPLCASNAVLVSLDGLQGLTPSPALPSLGEGASRRLTIPSPTWGGLGRGMRPSGLAQSYTK